MNQFTETEIVEVSDDEIIWHKRKYIFTTIDGRHICEPEYYRNSVGVWKFIRKPMTYLTRTKIAEKFGVENFEIID